MRLMISVVSAEEARKAVNGGSVLLDIKNPDEGSLGAQFPRVIRKIKEVTPGHIELSAAIGDMPSLPGTAALAALGAAVCGADYIKVGIYGPRSESEAIALMRAVREAVADFDTSVIAAGYADCHRAGTLDPGCLPHVAAAAGVHGCLLDTRVKDGHTLFDFIDIETLHSLAAQAHDAGLLFGAAGALRADHLPILEDAGVDVAGLRTAVCRNNRRTGPLEACRVDHLIRKCKK